jgi:hypothetical protein
MGLRVEPNQFLHIGGGRGLNVAGGDSTLLWTAVLNGADELINSGSHASIDDLHDGAMTVEGWFKINNAGFANIGGIIGKTATLSDGWFFEFHTSTVIKVRVICATTVSESYIDFTPDSTFHHFAVTFDDAGDRKARIYIDGSELTYLAQIAGVGAIVSDAGADLTIGTLSTLFTEMSVGWMRISNNIRYTGAFTPASRATPPTVDANTVRLYKVNEGAGAVITDYSANAQNAAMINGTWLDYP